MKNELNAVCTRQSHNWTSYHLKWNLQKELEQNTKFDARIDSFKHPPFSKRINVLRVTLRKEKLTGKCIDQSCVKMAPKPTKRYNICSPLLLRKRAVGRLVLSKPIKKFNRGGGKRYRNSIYCMKYIKLDPLASAIMIFQISQFSRNIAEHAHYSIP